MKTTRTLGSLAYFVISCIVIYSCSKIELKSPATESCETEFTAQAISCRLQRHAVYTFTSSDDLEKITIQGDLLDFSGEQALVTVSGGALSVTQTIEASGSSMNIKIEGDVSACEKVTITIMWYGNKPGGEITSNWSVMDSNGSALAEDIIPLECEIEK